MTALELASAIKAGTVRCDVGSGPFEHTDKHSYTDPALTGLRVTHWSLWGTGYGSGTLTGRMIFAYSGRGSALEMNCDDGSVAWVTEYRPIDGKAFTRALAIGRKVYWSNLEKHQEIRPVSRYWQGSKVRFFGVRIPRTVRLVDSRSFFHHGMRVHSLAENAVTDGLQSMCMCSHYSDMRRPMNAGYGRELMQKLRVSLAKDIKRWRKAKRDAKRLRKYAGNGGGVYHRPVLVSWGNFGYGVYGSHGVTVPFTPMRRRRVSK